MTIYDYLVPNVNSYIGARATELFQNGMDADWKKWETEKDVQGRSTGTGR